MEIFFLKVVDFLLKMRGSFFLCLEIMRSDVVRPRVQSAADGIWTNLLSHVLQFFTSNQTCSCAVSEET